MRVLELLLGDGSCWLLHHELAINSTATVLDSLNGVATKKGWSLFPNDDLRTAGPSVTNYDLVAPPLSIGGAAYTVSDYQSTVRGESMKTACSGLGSYDGSIILPATKHDGHF